MHQALTVGTDPLSGLLARYADAFPRRLERNEEHDACRVLIDSLAVAIGGLDASAAAAARRYARSVGAPGACRVWGTAIRTTPEIAALVNGVPLRAYDYNDLYYGPGDAGHPSDIVPAVVAVGEHVDASGAEVLAALALGYDIVLALLDTITVSPAWDYPNIVALGATCAVAKLLRLTAGQIAEALGITVVSHAASGEIESGDLNVRGDLTMWKRFNGADAMRQSIYACLLARAGVEGPVRPFVGKYGFLRLLAKDDSAAGKLEARLSEKRPRIGASTFKRWPVGSRAQSAIRAALEARAALPRLDEIREVRVETNPATYHHLVEVRSDPWNPSSRETADHALPYIVAAAVLDGRVDARSFDPAVVNEPSRKRFLAEKVRVTASLSPNPGDTVFPTRVTIETADGRASIGEALPPPGHPQRPLSDADLAEKFAECVAPYVGAADALGIVRKLWRVSEWPGVRDGFTFDAIRVAAEEEV
jgi:2-methylcitrate dehydratase